MREKAYDRPWRAARSESDRTTRMRSNPPIGQRLATSVSRLRSLRVVGLLLVLTQLAGDPIAAEAAPPTRGPGVLFSPFYYRNPGAKHERHQRGTTGLEQWNGLMGPLYWTNPSEGGYAVTPEPLPSDQLDTEWATTPQPQLYEPVIPVQGEEVPAPGVLSQPQVIPIPSATAPEQIAPPPSAGGAGPGTLSGAEALGEEPTEPRLQFLRAATVLLEPGELQIDTGLVYTLAENDFPAVVNTGMGDEILEGSLKQRNLFVPLEFRLGVTPRVQLFTSVPIGWAHNEFAIDGALDIDESDGGLGDISVGASFLLQDGQGVDTDVVFTVATTLPTGDSPFITGSTGFGAPTLGDNFYAISTDLIWINNYDPVVIFYGVGYRHQFEREIGGVQVDPGEEARVQLGVGFAVNRSVTLSTRFAASFISRTEFDGVSVAGSFNEPMSLRFAATVLRCKKIVEPFVDFGTTDDATSTSFGIIWTH